MEIIVIIIGFVWLFGLSIGYGYLQRRQKRLITRLNEKAEQDNLSVDAVALAVEEAIRERRLKL